jgi:hypothetical protein
MTPVGAAFRWPVKQGDAMSPQILLDTLRRQPFVPFRLYVADGSAYDIRHPELLLVTSHSAHVAIPPALSGMIPEHAVIIAMDHVSRLEKLPTSATPADGQQGT